MPKGSVTEIFDRLKSHTPSPKTELIYASNFELLIAVMLSAQATDKSVNAATAHLFKVANTPHALLQLGLSELERHIRTIGLYHSKAKHILATCDILISRYQGQVPDTRAALESLPGVGRKTANVILNTAFGQPTLAVDTHIFRLAHRIGLSKGTTPLAVEKSLMKIIPVSHMMEAHHLLILHGRYVCKAIKPLCHACVIDDLCTYQAKPI